SQSLFDFFFQAEDGIRDGHVTGVQTCALPIYPAMDRFTVPSGAAPSSGKLARTSQLSANRRPVLVPPWIVTPLRSRAVTLTSTRSEERRVGKEGRFRWAPFAVKIHGEW